MNKEYWGVWYGPQQKLHWPLYPTKQAALIAAESLEQPNVSQLFDSYYKAKVAGTSRAEPWVCQTGLRLEDFPPWPQNVPENIGK